MGASPAFVAVLVAVAESQEGGPAAALATPDGTLIGRLHAQIERCGGRVARVLTRAGWGPVIAAALPDVDVTEHHDLAGPLRSLAGLPDPGHNLVLAHAEVVVSDSALLGLVQDPSPASGVLTSSRRLSPVLLAPVTSLERGRVVAATSAFHATPSGRFRQLGLVRVAAADRGRLEEVAAELVGLIEGGVPPAWEEEFAGKVSNAAERWAKQHGHLLGLAGTLEAAPEVGPWLPKAQDVERDAVASLHESVSLPAEALRHDPIALLLTGLVRSDVAVTPTYLRKLFWARPLTSAGAAGALDTLATIDEDRDRLDSAVKASDGFFTTFLISPWSRYLARFAARRGLTPNQVTTASLLVGLTAAGAFALGGRPALIVGAVLLQVSFAFDCVDGQLARYTRQFSSLGAWLDAMFDRVKEYAVYAGLAIGATRTGADASIWALATAAMILQSVRHTIDFAYAANARDRRNVRVSARLADVHGSSTATTQTKPAAAAGSSAAAGAIQLARRLDGSRVGYWAKRIIVLPIGERWALISVTAALAGPRFAFLALLGWGAGAALYTVTGRVLRSVSAA